MDLGAHILSQYATVEEVEAGLSADTLQILYVATGGGVSVPLHWAVADAQGNYAVVEVTAPGEWEVSRGRAKKGGEQRNGMVGWPRKSSAAGARAAGGGARLRHPANHALRR